jgi:hypothetical protein
MYIYIFIPSGSWFRSFRLIHTTQPKAQKKAATKKFIKCEKKYLQGKKIVVIYRWTKERHPKKPIDFWKHSNVHIESYWSKEKDYNLSYIDVH